MNKGNLNLMNTLMKTLMKNLLLSGVLFSALSGTAVFAHCANHELQNRLNKISSFSADFSQTVTGADSTLIQQGRGQLSMQRPNLFNWHTTEPDESILISDGNTLWYYTPFVEQVTARWLKNTTADTPFMLLTRNNPDDWKQYNISQKGDDFQLIPKAVENNTKQFQITVTATGTIKNFTAIEQDGQQTTYRLINQQNGTINSAKFTFVPPQGVTLDDQRQ